MAAPRWVEPVVLEGSVVRLEPLSLDHAPGLWPHAGPEVFQWLADLPRDGSYEAFRDWIGLTMSRPASLTFALILVATGEPAGVSGYLDVRPEHRGIEIGRTWIGKAHQGSRVNPESKCCNAPGRILSHLAALSLGGRSTTNGASSCPR